MKAKPALAGIAALLLAQACALKPTPQPGQVLGEALPAGTTVPDGWAAASAASPVADNWVASFNDPVLDQLVSEALARNTDLLAASARVEVARQAVNLVGAALLPAVNGELGGRSTDVEDEGTSNTAVASLSVGWELDVWGRLRAAKAAAAEGYRATALDYAFARQSLAATVAGSWYATTTTLQLLDLARESVQIYTRMLTLVETRRAAGKVSDLDVVDVRANLRQAQSAEQASLQLYNEARRALETLLGRYPAAEIATQAQFPPLPGPVAAGVPAAVLARRPDIAAAEAQVLAAFRREEAARLSLLPDFNLSLAGGKLGSQFTSVLDGDPWLGSAAIGMYIPIYEGGALRAKLAIATAAQQAAVADYGGAVLGAFREVENSLAAEDVISRRIPLQTQELADRRSAVTIATTQYQAGRIDLLWVSQLQDLQITSAADLIRLRGSQYFNRIRLHLALGGSFEAAPAIPVADAR